MTSTIRLLVRVAAFLAFFSTLALAQTGVTVKITKKTALELVSSSGEITGVTESTVGAKFTLVTASLPQLILQDAQGARYLVAVNATDYTLPPPAAAPVSTTNLAPQIAKPPATPPPALPVVTVKPIAPTPSPTAPAEGKQITVPMGDRGDHNLVAIWPESGMAGRPLLVVAHGHGGSAPMKFTAGLPLPKPTASQSCARPFSRPSAQKDCPTMNATSATACAGSKTIFNTTRTMST